MASSESSLDLPVAATDPIEQSETVAMISTKKKHSFQTKASLILTACFLALLAIFAALFSEQELEGVHAHRFLEDNNGKTDYGDSSCSQIFVLTEKGSDAQCQFARTCNYGEGLFAPFVFCSKNFSPSTWTWILSPFLFIWLVLLFRMLGSTAEDFFSPSLEMFSYKLGLPPRFAGVTLLALGNGAADVSATVNAITSDVQNGYQLSLGALTGSGMFVGGVVAGIVMIVAGGVPCRGALVRDVMALLITVLAVWYQMHKGSIGTSDISFFCSLYILFVLIVLVADVYHRAVVLPRLQAQAAQVERQRQLQEGKIATDQAGDMLNNLANETTPSGEEDALEMTSDPAAAPRTARPSMAQSVLNSVMVALSNYGPDEVPNNERRPDGWGVESDDLLHERPIVLHGAHGVLADAHHNHPHSQNPNQDPFAAGTEYQAMTDDGTGMFCTEEGSLGFSAANWTGAFHDGKEELIAHFVAVWEDIVDNPENTKLDQFFQICELPFVVARKITIPLPCDGFYCRGLVALSVFLSPCWFAFYMWNEHDMSMFPLVLFAILGSAVIAVLVLRFAPGGAGTMALLFAGPIALYGFAIAATWIDFIADQLVGLLDFLGTICRIPGSVMGLTILAWGNSMGDLSANMALSRKGLANMAITACFAGPVFNILIGLAAGFSSLSARTGEAEKEVIISASVLTGFIFVIINTLMIILSGVFITKGVIPKAYGYVALFLYTIYVVTSLVLQFSKYGDNN